MLRGQSSLPINERIAVIEFERGASITANADTIAEMSRRLRIGAAAAERAGAPGHAFALRMFADCLDGDFRDIARDRHGR